MSQTEQLMKYRVAQGALVLVVLTVVALLAWALYWIDGWVAVGLVVAGFVLAGAGVWALDVVGSISDSAPHR